MYLKLLEENDLIEVLSIRNNDNIRKYMFNTSIISIDSHLKWFEKYIQDDSKKTYVLKENNHKIIGVVNFNFLSENKKIVDWGFYVIPTAAKGTGTILLKLALNKLFKEYHIQKVFGQVIEFNDKSIHIHKKLGFKLEGILRKHYQRNERFYDIYEFGLLKDEFIKIK